MRRRPHNYAYSGARQARVTQYVAMCGVAL
jgi:hypothetical protein